ncbi:hypothetical protein [Streptomyces zingiberis]|uniref:PE-PGRS family protein n=1 Tax=Streptomyces zingiberis TaxID=2053010 RepID=A0ABX1C2P9_9ACTN|nr:hypothetical protein [Streptomyces zingiberis]NJQ01174.1 hypothetical protein [Streptomyces zingiberis]
MTVGWCARAARAVVFAAVCALLAALGHVLMSGVALPWWAPAAAFAGTAAAAGCLAGRERGPLLVTVFTVGVQTALHLWFSFAQSVAGSAPSCGEPATGGRLPCPPGGAAPAGGAVPTASTAAHVLGHHPGHGAEPPAPAESLAQGAHSLTGAAGPADGVLSAGHLTHAADGMSLGMLAAHLLAALVCGVWLAHGERAVFRIRRVLRTLAGRLTVPLWLPLLLLSPPGPPHRPRVRARRGHVAPAPRRLLLVSAITFRGPPVGAAVR